MTAVTVSVLDKRRQHPPVLSHRTDDPLLQGPLPQVGILGLAPPLSPFKVLADVLHAALPAVAAGELLLAEATLAPLRRLALFMPAARANFFEARLEGVPLLWGGSSRLGQPGSVHAALVLREEVLAVEIVRHATPAGAAGAAVVFCMSAGTFVLR